MNEEEKKEFQLMKERAIERRKLDSNTVFDKIYYEVAGIVTFG